MEDGMTRLMRKQRPEFIPVDEKSIALFRLGEQCNNACPMCSNSGRPEAFYQALDDLMGRADFLHDSGIRRVVLTGGEPTIHPGFWTIVDRLNEFEIIWDINTHGRSFSNMEFTQKSVQEGLRRAIVSLHSHIPEASALISGCSLNGHWETIEGIKNLQKSSVWLMLNIVLNTHNQGTLCEYLEYCASEFGTNYRVKIVFPSTAGKGGEWEPIHLKYEEISGEVAKAKKVAADLGLQLAFENFPSCVLNDRESRNISRSGFGETHYLDDVSGRDLYSIRHIEAFFNVYPESCRDCSAIKRCPGIAESYAKEHGADVLTPFT
jgi:MoaA/NifB/PqqE/SkfB family radical SAM enzyme